MIIMNCAHGLGNRLFYFAHCLALAEATGHTVVSLDIPEAGTVFEGRHGTFCVWPKSSRLAFPWPNWVRLRVYSIFLRFLGRWLKRAPGWVKIVEASLDHTREIGLRDRAFMAMLQSHRLIIMRGWPAIQEIELRNPEAVRSFFSPSRGIAEKARSLALAAKGDADILIGVHCRWGDYARYGGGRFHFPLESYARVMRHCAGLFPDRRVAFLVVTDEPEKLRQSRTFFAGLAITLGLGTPEHDLFGLAECDYLVSPASSFSLWAGFYGRKPVWCMDRAEALPQIADFVVYEKTFQGAHPEGEASPAATREPQKPSSANFSWKIVRDLPGETPPHP